MGGVRGEHVGHLVQNIRANGKSVQVALRGLFNIDAPALTEPVVAPPRAASKEYSAYIVAYSGCWDCHGEKLDGRPSGPVPPGPDMRPVATLSREAFINLVRARGNSTGTGRASAMHDEELAAMHLFLGSLAK